MNYGLFGLVLAFTLLLTFVVTGLHAFRTAQLNPADTLKHE
jgi:ABC-type lipoprotein release transport system permease subunit